MNAIHPEFMAGLVKANVTESEAQAHCKRPDTRKEGLYFDGYEYMKGCKP